ncbi:MAG: ATP-dependent DNA helicase RecG [Gammaproteobacteria bacterium]|nr:ATP-dependent DNA helicase RecG [Gammaproteobacteria bacterium]
MTGPLLRSPALSLQSPLTALRGVGERMAQRLARLGIHRVIDLLWQIPLRYQDRSHLTALAELQIGSEALFQGEVLRSEVRFGRRRMLLVTLADGSGEILLRFFHFSAPQQATLAPGTWLRCYGEVRPRAAAARVQDMLPRVPQSGKLEVVHPEYRVIMPDEPLSAEAAAVLTAIYPAGDGIGQPLLRRLVAQAVRCLVQTPMTDAHARIEWLPPQWLSPLGLPDLPTALQIIHQPPSRSDARALLSGQHPIQRRLALEELLVQQLAVRRVRQHHAAQHHAPVLDGPQALRESLLAALPFALTGAQQRVITEIISDLAQTRPMQRLVQGDVGSGKTVVAMLAVVQAVASGCQAAVMAPTEILAEQHFHSFRAALQPLGIEVGWLAGRLRAGERRDTRQQLAAGVIQVVVGTHALFQQGVEFAQLGLVIIDEQHRFGVHQRLALRNKGVSGDQVPHQLIMTATPIPRTMVMTAYADLDCSVIDELPPGRLPVNTVVVADQRRDQVLERVRAACGLGQQAYWVCTLIEESDVLQCQAAQQSAQRLAEALPGLKVGLLHGRMKPADKEAIMRAFKQRELDLLVATTVIEVGVDVPNATLMIIEDADRLGLAQLHQLRGRVGRGQSQSSCVLMYQAPLSQRGRERLAVMRDTRDGFEVARRDLELRGPGEILGTRQTGEQMFRVADLLRDQDLIPEAARLAERLLHEYPERVTPVIRRWLGEASRYAEV